MEESVPKKYRELAGILGLNATERLCRAYGGKRLYIPVLRALEAQKRRERIRKEYLSGSNTSSLAQKYQVSQRAVQRIVKDLRPRKKGAAL